MIYSHREKLRFGGPCAQVEMQQPPGNSAVCDVEHEWRGCGLTKSQQEGSVREQYPVTDIQDQEAMLYTFSIDVKVDSFCIQCHHLYLDQQKVLPFPWGWGLGAFDQAMLILSIHIHSGLHLLPKAGNDPAIVCLGRMNQHWFIKKWRFK